MITISPSQIEAFSPEYGGCERKWAFDKIDKIPRVPNKYAQAGTELHTIAEQWLRDGIAPPVTEIGEAFRGGMAHLPLPRTVEVEVEARFERNGIHYFEKLDAFHTTLATEGPSEWSDALVAHVLDHKSTGNMQWADDKQAALLEHRDPQWLMYGTWAAQEHEADLVQGEWIYYLRRKPYSSRKLTVSATAAALLERFDEKIHPVSLRIIQARTEPSSARPKNLQACNRFGGCPYREHCLASVSPLKRIAAMSDLSTARERIAARSANARGASTGETPLARKLRERREALEAQQAAATFTTKVQTTEQPAAEPPPAKWTPGEDTHAPAPPTPTQVVEQRMRDEADTKAAIDEAVEVMCAASPALPVELAPFKAPEPSDQPPAEPEKRKRGRPKGSGKKATPMLANVKARLDQALTETMVIPPSNTDDTSSKPPIVGEAKLGDFVYPFNVAEAHARAVENGGKLDVLVRLHVAAIAAHQPPELANAHYRSILEQIEGER